MEKTLKKTHVHDWHVKHARMIEFAGFHMPVWYTSIEDEHMAVRNSVGIFDVTHMGRFFVVGSEATDFLNYVVTRDVKKAANGQALYSVMLNEKGGIVDDLIVYKINPERFLVVVNASNKEKDFKEFLNPNSLNIIEKAFVEPSVKNAKALSYYQFERLGYFNVDKDSTKDLMVFNKTVGLRDSWAKAGKK